MFNVLSKHKFGAIFISLCFLPLYTPGQDLGSSTNILKKPSSKATSTTKKKVPKKKAPAKAAAKAAPREPAAARKTVPKKEAIPVVAADQADKISAKNGRMNTADSIVNARPQSDLMVSDSEQSVGNTSELFEAAIEEGNIQRNARNYEEAEAAYRRGQSLQLDDARAIYGLGNLYSDQQRWEEAERAYRLAIKLDPRSPNAFIALSFVLTQPVVGTNLMVRYGEAEKLARSAIEFAMDDAVAHDQLGVAMELQGKISSETQDQYQKAVALDPTFALAYAHLGRLLRRNGRVAESNEAYISSIQFSLDVPTMILVADVMQSQQRYADSEQLLRRALREDPKNPTALYLLGRALTTLGAFEEAEQILKKSAEVSPRSFVSYMLLGSLFLRQRNFETAENYLEKALKVVSTNEQKRLAYEFESVGDGFLSTGKKPDAARVYKKAIALDGGRSDLMAKLAAATGKGSDR